MSAKTKINPIPGLLVLALIGTGLFFAHRAVDRQVKNDRLVLMTAASSKSTTTVDWRIGAESGSWAMVNGQFQVSRHTYQGANAWMVISDAKAVGAISVNGVIIPTQPDRKQITVRIALVVP